MAFYTNCHFDTEYKCSYETWVRHSGLIHETPPTDLIYSRQEEDDIVGPLRITFIARSGEYFFKVEQIPKYSQALCNSEVIPGAELDIDRELGDTNDPIVLCPACYGSSRDCQICGGGGGVPKYLTDEYDEWREQRSA